MPKSHKAAARQDRQTSRRGNQNHDALIALAIEDQVRSERRKPASGPVIPLTEGQRRYDAAIRSSSIIFGTGPAGTGKTWFAIQRAAKALLDRQIDKIIVTRPAVEVERSMGFMPGDMGEKFDPYLIPVREAFIDALGETHYEYLIGHGRIVPLPLAFMRGSTIKNAWLIGDEMQNATSGEFKMLLTRIGENAKFVINGDPRQVDRGIRSGLEEAVRLVGSIGDVSVIRFGIDEIVRSGICQQIVEAYENNSETPASESVYSQRENERAGLERFLNAGMCNNAGESIAA